VPGRDPGRPPRRADDPRRPRGGKRATFRYKDKGSLATIGRASAVAQIGARSHHGFLAWLLWWVIHIFYLIGFKNRFFVMFSWAWSWLTFQRGARLITGEVGALPAIHGIGADGARALPPAGETISPR
jgi:NADH dehydrogenase